MARSLTELHADMKALLTNKQSTASQQNETSQSNPRCELSFREETRRVFVDVVQKHFIDAGERPAPRPVFRKVHGVARASLRMSSAIPDRFRHGLFAHSEFAAWVRFSSDTAPNTPDSANSTLGIGIKLFGVHGDTLDADDPDAGTADLVMQNHDRFFVDTGQDFCAFSEAAVFGDIEAYLAAHPETKVVLDEMAKPEASVLTATYWSVLPYACGPEAIVKYRLRPLDAPKQTPAAGSDPNFLKVDLAQHLSSGEAVFEFAVQGFSMESETPIDAATRRWPTPFDAIGTLTIEQQDINRIGQSIYGDNISIHPWRTPEANRPLGSIADSRRITYRSSAYLRRNTNGVPTVEPRSPR
ncbi:catalase [Sinorhizobium meliloti]|uniref:hypothetical protein n=1 Tax=Rhizobium meliloti TaxID=382 RepID=UPI001F1C7509|nr:hypothetical protein [Sinorhizobium meliloti]MBP2470652.1 catalase [Sinorhizobium meliloti]MDE4550490.1 hypothetical protein [Sinorhizobium meliloti]MDE4598090.1 hypothetical protein [Sinorhizobium meliloti]